MRPSQAPPVSRPAPEPAAPLQDEPLAPEAPEPLPSGNMTLAQRVAAGCGPRLRTLLARVRIEQVGSDEFELHADPAQRAMVEAHLSELRPVFEKALGIRGLSLRLGGEGDVAGRAEPQIETPMLRTSTDAELEHPLVKEVASLFGATPKSVQPRGK